MAQLRIRNQRCECFTKRHGSVFYEHSCFTINDCFIDTWRLAGNNRYTEKVRLKVHDPEPFTIVLGLRRRHDKNISTTVIHNQRIVGHISVQPHARIKAKRSNTLRQNIAHRSITHDVIGNPRHVPYCLQHFAMAFSLHKTRNRQQTYVRCRWNHLLRCDVRKLNELVTHAWVQHERPSNVCKYCNLPCQGQGIGDDALCPAQDPPCQPCFPCIATCAVEIHAMEKNNILGAAYHACHPRRSTKRQDVLNPHLSSIGKNAPNQTDVTALRLHDHNLNAIRKRFSDRINVTANTAAGRGRLKRQEKDFGHTFSAGG